MTSVLVVDNNPVLLRAISAILEQEGCVVRAVPNGLDALNMLKEYTPDIIFTDLVMPLVGGEQLCRKVRNSKEHKETYLVVISGIVLEDFDKILGEELYDLCISKGNLKELRTHLRAALKRYEEFRRNGKKHDFSGIPRIQGESRPSDVASELLSEKRHLRKILENLEEGIVEMNQEGVVVSLNSAALRILGGTEDQIIGSALTDLNWGEHNGGVSEWVSKLSEGVDYGQFDILEDYPLRVSGNIITASFLSVRDEGEVFSLCILHDITRQFFAEQQKKELDNAIKLVTKMDALSSMAGGIAHDFNNLLTVICGNLDIACHSGCSYSKEERAKILEHVRTAAYMAVDLTRKISKSSPFGIVSRRNHALEDVVKTAVAQFEKEYDTRCSISLCREGSVVDIDADQIKTVLGNILKNAIEADADGRIEVTTKNMEFSEPSVIAGQYVPAGKYGCATVSDSGFGIDTESLVKIFDPYYSTKARGASKGMGLGLAVVYATMRNHGGYVVVESEQGKGTSVSCFLPRYAGADISKKDGSGKAEKCRVLLIENDLQLQEVGKVMIEYLGYEAEVASSLKDGLNRVKIDKARKSGKIHLVILDPAQEQRDDHKEVCSTFKKLNDKLHIIITGSAVPDPAMKACRQYGYANALPKPFTMDSLKHVLLSLEG